MTQQPTYPTSDVLALIRPPAEPPATAVLPRNLHQFWTGDRPMPAVFDRWREAWRRLHPDWTYRLWSLDDVRAIDPQMAEMAEHAVSPSVASDCARVAVVNHVGGVYVDCDFEPVKPLDPLLGTLPAFYVNLDAAGDAASAIFGATPGHSWMGEIRRLMLEDNLSHQAWPPWQVHLMRAVAVVHNVHDLPWNLFYPYGYGERELIDAPASTWPGVYAVHRHAGSWMQDKSIAKFGDMMANFYSKSTFENQT